MKRALLLAASLSLFGATSSFAEDPQQAFTALIARGFKIVGTSAIPYKDDLANQQAIVTLQLDKAVAVCTFSIGNWENMLQSVLENPQNCDVRFY